MRIALGGPIYNGVSAATEDTTIRMLARAARHGVGIAWCEREQGCSIDLNRCELFAHAMESDVEWLLTLDADTAVGNVDELFRMLHEAPADATLVAAPVVTKRGTWNVLIDGGTIIGLKAGFERVETVGLACAALRMSWYRDHWPPALAPFQTLIVPHPTRPGRWAKETEDYRHGRMVGQLGGAVYVDGRVGTLHPV